MTGKSQILMFRLLRLLALMGACAAIAFVLASCNGEGNGVHRQGHNRPAIDGAMIQRMAYSPQ